MMKTRGHPPFEYRHTVQLTDKQVAILIDAIATAVNESQFDEYDDEAQDVWNRLGKLYDELNVNPNPK